MNILSPQLWTFFSKERLKVCVPKLDGGAQYLIRHAALSMFTICMKISFEDFWRENARK